MKEENREFLDYLEDMLNALSRIEEYTHDIEYEDFINSHLIQDGIIRQLEILGEASKRIPVSVRDRHPEIPWRAMAGMRDKMIHEYAGVDMDVVWKVATVNIPEDKQKIMKILEEEKELEKNKNKKFTVETRSVVNILE